MTKVEVLRLLNKIKTYYPNFSLEDYVKEEWIEKLKDYSNDEVAEKFEKYLKSEEAQEQPKLHFLVRDLKTYQEKEIASKQSATDYIIRCNLCGKEMRLSYYDNVHYDKCLMIKTLIPILKARGEDVDYDTLDKYDTNTLNKVIEKYLPIKKDLKDLI